MSNDIKSVKQERFQPYLTGFHCSLNDKLMKYPKTAFSPLALAGVMADLSGLIVMNIIN